MIVAIPKESSPGERRVAGTPDTVQKLAALGFEVRVEKGAGAAASFPDAAYEAAGATLVEDPKALFSEADLLLKVEPPREREDHGGAHEVDWLKEGATLVAFLWPQTHDELVGRLEARKVTAFAVDQVPRITRAQSMDALSSMANIAGYRAVIEAAHHFGSFFTAQMTAAGSLPPAKVLVIGAGVAGLAAIGAARGLGAIVRAFDTRLAVKDQVRSLGGEFLELEFDEDGEGEGGYAKVMSKEFIDAEMAMFREQAEEVDIVVTTALIPGRPAPTLWTKDMVEAMKPGSVVVDLAAAAGGNCELTKAGEVVEHDNVKILGFVDLTSRLATTSSQLYGNNLVKLVTHLLDDGELAIDLDDEITRGCIVTKDGEILWPPPARPEPSPRRPEPEKAAPAEKATPPAMDHVEPSPAIPKDPHLKPASGRRTWVGLIGLVLAGLWIWARIAKGDAPADPETAIFLEKLTVFVLAVFVGWQVIWNVSPALHTPLMSVTNAISGIIILGGILQAHGGGVDASFILGLAAVLLATINVAGGFLVTQRMLRMFHK